MDKLHEVINQSRAQKEYLYKRYKVKEIGIFGSIARGEEEETQGR